MNSISIFSCVLCTGEATEDEKQLSRTIMKYWSNFARNGWEFGYFETLNFDGWVTWWEYAKGKLNSWLCYFQESEWRRPGGMAILWSAGRVSRIKLGTKEIEETEKQLCGLLVKGPAWKNENNNWRENTPRAVKCCIFMSLAAGLTGVHHQSCLAWIVKLIKQALFRQSRNECNL